MNPPYHGPHNGPQHDVHARLLGEPFHIAAPFLRVLLTGEPTMLGPDQLAYSINPYLTAMVGYRLHPATYESAIMEKRHAQAWGVSKQDLWFTALGNMAYDRYEPQALQAAGDTVVHAVHGVTWPGSAHMMRLVEVMREPAPFGAVVMLPNPNTLLYAVLRSKRSGPVLAALHRHHQSMVPPEGPVSDQLILWRGGRVSGMSTRPGPDGAVQIKKSQEFRFLLDHELPD
ncbi:hypothetical protein HDA32_001252 [Spinactinospora alkalitolerans]|uniref:Uncharacterized protein n=1 Tax=Spinactinospora alkalitolerans TaxID=687207 RepID=A0A852TTE7_9ACTN|nr:hypothetical protein [Spinactinospora alkalitolerans]NYE46132.1 hypothetical protein [Spinactinospora alkalitolerans]